MLEYIVGYGEWFAVSFCFQSQELGLLISDGAEAK
jgi:hypothetical protein